MAAGFMERLGEKSREELLALLEQLVKRQPEIKSLVELLMELPEVTAVRQEEQTGKGRKRTVDPSSISSQVDSAFYDAGDDWDAASDIAIDLEKLCDIGKNFAEAGEWANAQIVYATIAEDTLLQYDDVQDEGEIGWVLDRCAVGLLDCLKVQSTLPESERLETPEREELLASLFDLWKFGYHHAIDADIAGTIAEHVSEDERESVEYWLREEMRPPGQDSSYNHSVVTFLTTLKPARLFGEESVLEEYRKAGLYKDLADKLVEFGHEDEALEVARAYLTEERDVTRFAEQLLKAGEAWQEQALEFVETRLKEIESRLTRQTQDYRSKYVVDTYRHWLSEKYLLYGKVKQALDMEITRFQASPDHTTYRSVQSAAQATGQPEDLWAGLRQELIQTLEQQRNWDALVSIYLDEGEVGQALATLGEMERASRTSFLASSYPARVAKAAEESYPDEAIRLYKPIVQRLIDARGRGSYQQAASYLVQVRSLYQRQQREGEWREYITNLRNSNKNLRALREELDKKCL